LVNLSPLGFFKKDGKTRPIMGGVVAPIRTVGSRGALPKKQSAIATGGKLSLDLAKRSGSFAFNQAKKFNEAQKERERLQREQQETQKDIEETLSKLEQIEIEEVEDIKTEQAIAQAIPSQRPIAERKIEKIEKKADKDEKKEAKKLEKQREEEKKTEKQLQEQSDRISQITLILKPSKFT